MELHKWKKGSGVLVFSFGPAICVGHTTKHIELRTGTPWCVFSMLSRVWSP